MNHFSRHARVALLALLWTAMPGHATTVRPMNIVDLIDNAETIVAGRVERVSDGFAANGMPYTEVTVRVLDRFRGTQAKFSEIVIGIVTDDSFFFRREE